MRNLIEIVSKNYNSIPEAPESSSIPDGSMRRFHVTTVNNIENIKKHGLMMDYTKGIEGPRAIYSWTNYKDAKQYGSGNHAAIVEFHHNPKNYEDHPYATVTNVPPENILGIHEHWHDHYRFAKKNNIPLKRFERLLHDPDYKKAHDALESEGYE